MNVAKNIEMCTGCMLCYNICPVDAIKMVPDEKGFLYPVIQTEQCIGCGACERKCPANDDNVNLKNFSAIDNDKSVSLVDKTQSYKKIVKAAWSKNKKTRSKSSSGGLFSVLAEAVLKQGGVICASKFTYDFYKVEFDICENIEDLNPFCGSKYIQSSPNMIYRRIKHILKSGRKVLFVGTGCQVAALKRYLDTSFENLICIDLVCHGVPSPKIWKDYIDYLISKHDQKAVKDVSFRTKEPSWKEYSLKVVFEDGKTYQKPKIKDPYMIAFAKDIMLRPSCSHCQYACLEREGDITLCDFWAYRSFNFKTRNTEKGISCCIINSAKGKVLFDLISDKLVIEDKDIKEAISGNRSLVRPWNNNKESEKFWLSYEENGMDALFEYCQPYKNSYKMKLNWFIMDHLWIIPKPLLKRILNRKNRL